MAEAEIKRVKRTTEGRNGPFDYETEVIVFPNGVEIDMYEPRIIKKMILDGNEYYIASGHEEIAVYDLDGNQLFHQFTR